MKKLHFIYIFIFISCSNHKTIESLDITVRYNDFKKFYKIYKDGKILYLKKTINASDSLFETNLTRNEYKSLQNSFDNILKEKCDSTENFYVDGTNYRIILTDNSSIKTVFLSNTCLNYKDLDQVVFSFVKRIDKKKKTLVFESIEKEFR